MKKLLFIIMLLPFISFAQDLTKEVIRIGSDSMEITFGGNRYTKEFKEADKAFFTPNLLMGNINKTTTDTIQIKALCSLDFAFGDNVTSDDRILYTFSTDLLEVRKLSTWFAPEHVKYLSMGNKLPVAKSLIVWMAKEIK